MKIDELKGKKIAVLGLGVEGQSSVRYLALKKLDVTVLEKKPVEELDKEVVGRIKEMGDIGIIGGKDYLSSLSDFDVIIRSPGIKRNTPEILAAEEKGVLVTSQTQLFFDMCPCEIIGVTGTKGKGTTSALIYEMLKKSGKDAWLGGNIGKPPFDFLDTLSNQSKVVLELSSFQLEDVKTSPHIGVILMVTQEHLGADTVGTQNYHETIEDYISAKRNLFRFQTENDFAITNRDYPASNESDVYSSGKLYQVSLERGVMDEGCYLKEEAVWLLKDGSEQKIIDTKDILLPGKHNVENVCAAVMAATLSGVSKQDIKEVLKTFKGLEHRLEFVASVDGVRYFDDSFSTTPETAIAAIQAFPHPEVIILGGSQKGSDFAELGKVIAHSPNIRAVIGIGIEWDRIKDAILTYSDKVFMIEGALDMPTVVAAAAKIAKPGDVVLLSPACASFGMFNNYKERGNLFKEEVLRLLK